MFSETRKHQNDTRLKMIVNRVQSLELRLEYRIYSISKDSQKR